MVSGGNLKIRPIAKPYHRLQRKDNNFFSNNKLKPKQFNNGRKNYNYSRVYPD